MKQKIDWPIILPMSALIIAQLIVYSYFIRLRSLDLAESIDAINSTQVNFPTHKIEIDTTIATGTASWYDYQLSGEWWSTEHATAASRDLERYQHYRVTNLKNNKSVIVFINDYGPEAWTGRVIDLSSYAFAQISNLKLGLAEVKIEPYEKN